MNGRAVKSSAATSAESRRALCPGEHASGEDRFLVTGGPPSKPADAGVLARWARWEVRVKQVPPRNVPGAEGVVERLMARGTGGTATCG